MVQDIKNLIEKIQQEGVRVAEDKAAEIESQAKQEAAQIVERAKNEAGRLISDGKKELSHAREKQEKLLTQAARDLLLTLRKEINAMLERLILKEAKDTLVPQAMSKIISEIIKGQARQEVIISLNKKDLADLEKELLHKLKEHIKEKIVLKPSEDISAGFVISFDKGKSHFDFSDKALAEYIGAYLKPKLEELLKSATS